jgi:prepilin-type N-terminal cleavage/methylation domain-containing protein
MSNGNSNNKRGFTLVELLIGIVIISALGATSFVALDPGKRFAESRNSRRYAEVRTILDAAFLYNADHGEFPPGMDDQVKMIGTSGSGCAAVCGQTARADVEDDGFWVRPALAGDTEPPQIVSAHVEPTKVLPGDTMTVRAEIESEAEIRKVSADMGGIKTIELDLAGGDAYDGSWQAEWLVHGTVIKDYTTTITAVNIFGQTATYDIEWSDPTGWISPTGHSDPGNQWSNETNAYDGNSSSYASNTFGGAGWGQFIVLSMATSTLSDRLRVKADYQDAIIQEVDIDIYTGGSWVDAFQGGDEATWNGKFVEITYAKSEITQVRFRYNYSSGGYYYWFYELEVYQAAPVVTLPTCGTYPATAVQRTAAILHSAVSDDGGEPCEYNFNYGETVAYGNSTGWEGSVLTNDLVSKLVTGLDPGTTYHFQGQLRNSSGTVSCLDNQFTTKVVDTGWILPTGDNDPGGGWDNEENAYDDTTATYAASWHQIGDPVWSDYLYLTHDAIASNKIRFFARGGSEVAGADIDVYRDGQWVNVYDGTVNNLSWMEVEFDPGLVTQARIRFSAAYTNRGFFWELYEFLFWKYTATSDDSCLDLAAYLAPDYLPVVPVDPKIGTESRTYYAVKLESDNSLRVIACYAELGETIEVRR